MKNGLSLRIYLLLSGTIFLLVSLLHLFRLVYGWPVTVDGHEVPQLPSYFGFPVAMAYAGWALHLFRGVASAGR